jgi:hypothetical protein
MTFLHFSLTITGDDKRIFQSNRDIYCLINHLYFFGIGRIKNILIFIYKYRLEFKMDI